MLQVEMSASVRNSSGKGPMRQLRMKGMTPGVVYGGGAEALKLQMDTKSLMAKLLKFYRYNTVVTLKIDGEADKSVMIGEVQTNPVTDTLVHVDFCEIDLDKERSYKVPIAYKGTAKGVDLGGVLVTPVQEVDVLGKPLDIPDEIVVDISDLQIGQSLKCKTFEVPSNVTMITPGKTVAVMVNKPGEKVKDDDDEDAVEEAAPEETAAE